MNTFDRNAAIRLWDETERALHVRGESYIDDPDSMYIEPFRIFGTLYHVGDRVVSIHLLDTGDGLILFDSGFPHTATRLLRNISGLGFSPADVKIVLHTHEHYDHFGASRLLQTSCGSTMYIHEKGAEVFRLRPHHTEIQSAHCPEASLFIPDIELKDGDVITLGDTSISCVHTPGHSDGAITCFFDLEENGQKIRAGLCGVNGTLPLHPGRLLKYGIPLSAGKEYLDSIDRMMKEKVDLALDTHPRPGGIVERHLAGSSRMVDPELWYTNLEDYRSRYLEMMDRFETSLGSLQSR